MIPKETTLLTLTASHTRTHTHTTHTHTHTHEREEGERIQNHPNNLLLNRTQHTVLYLMRILAFF